MALRRLWSQKMRSLGVEYEILDPMDCSTDEWRAVQANARQAGDLVRALRALGSVRARLGAIDILTKRGLLQTFGLDRMDDRELFETFEHAIQNGRFLVLARRADLPAPRAAAGSPAPPPQPPTAKRVVLDKFVRVLLFDCQGGVVPSKSGPPSARIEVRAQTGETYSASIAGGKADVSGIPGSTPSACRIVFLGVADGREPVPAELPRPRAPANAKAMARGFLADPILVTRKQLNKDAPFDGWLNGTNWFQLRRREVDVVELEHFDDGGALLWPGDAPTSREFNDGAPRVRGIDAMRACLLLAADSAPDHVLVTGHGADVSQQRADGVKALLTGDANSRKIWVGIALATATVADQQAFLKWAALEFGWGSDPGAIDGRLGPNTKAAIRAFQSDYNTDQDAGLFPSSNPDGPLKVDGIIGKYTTGASFDCWQRALIMSADASATGAVSVQSIPARGPRATGCGTRHLSSPFQGADNRRAVQRTVEVVVLDAGDDVPVVCTADAPSPCVAPTCELYDPREFAFDYQSVAALKLAGSVPCWTVQVPPWVSGTVELVALDASGTELTRMPLASAAPLDDQYVAFDLSSLDPAATAAIELRSDDACILPPVQVALTPLRTLARSRGSPSDNEFAFVSLVRPPSGTA